jgi:hypothetical protein
LGVPDFEFTWELRLIFDKKVEKLKESQFLISRLVTSDAMNSERKAQLKAIIEQYKALGTFHVKYHQQVLLSSRRNDILAVGLWMSGFKRTLASKKKVTETKSNPPQRVGNSKNMK